MSCQQASRFLTSNNNIRNSNICKNLNSNINNPNIIVKGDTCKTQETAEIVVLQQEDPYVFTESVPTTLPTLFNIQKTRTRLNDPTSETLSLGKLQQKQQQQNLYFTETNGKLTSNLLKTQASFLPSSSISSSSSISTTKNSSTIATSKNIIQPLAVTNATTLNNNNNNNNSKKLTNVCIVRPQLQQQQPNCHQQNYINSSSIYVGDLKSISPPPLYTPPTTSLWQTPLLLESPAATIANKSGGSLLTNVVVASKAATTKSQTTPLMGCVTPIVQTVGSTTAILNPSLTTTTTAKVAPIIIHTPLAPPSPPSSAQSHNQCLPPSKFHNHTLAQHLHKVECLKKSKILPQTEMIICNDNAKTNAPPLKIAAPLTPTTADSLKLDDQDSKPVKHSETEDLNEIPINVIYRMAMVPQTNDTPLNNIQFVKTQTEPLNASEKSLQLKTNMNKILLTPASKKEQQQQNNTSSSIQLQNATTTSKPTTALKYHQNQTPNNNSKIPLVPPTNPTPTVVKIISNDDSIKTTNATHISNKTRKLNTITSLATSKYELVDSNWQMGCSTTKGAVAIVKMSQHHFDFDTTHLATAIGLPYCIQQYWMNMFDLPKSSQFLNMKKMTFSRSSAREERIAVYKQELQRQAIQLLSIRSLQKLPMKIAKRRLLTIDRLLRKYQQSELNKKVLPANVKRCCANGCDAYTLEMAAHCQQHIVYNTAQHVFLPCTAKFADNTQCRVPVFDITHDLPLCMEHARKRDAYNRLLHEQRPRKISTNPILTNSSMLAAAKVTAAISTDGKIKIKTQNSQQKQQQQQKQKVNILQQLPANNVTTNISNNKRPPIARKRKIIGVLPGNPAGRPQKRARKTVVETSAAEIATVTNRQMPHLTSTNLKRKNSTTSLESIASNSQHSTTSNTSQQQRQQPQQQHLYGVATTIGSRIVSSLPPPALAPLSGGLLGHDLPQHLFSFGHDNHHQQQQQQKQHHKQTQRRKECRPLYLNDKHFFSAITTPTSATASTPTELKDLISQFSFAPKKHAQAETLSDINFINNNSNSNFTSSGMGSTTSLPTADDFLTQDMLSICENSSASSADTGLGGLSDPELMLGGPEDMPLGDTHLLEEHDLENVLNSLPEDAFKELFTTVHQDESDEIERAIELADKHLKTLQQTIGSELGDFLNFNDDMLIDNGDLCSGSTAASILDTTALFVEAVGESATTLGVAPTLATNSTQGGGAAALIEKDVRGLVQT